MDSLIRQGTKKLQFLWTILVISMVSYVPIVYFTVQKEKLRRSAPNDLEGMGPIFFGLSIALGIISIWQYRHFTTTQQIKQKIQNKSGSPEKYFKDSKTGRVEQEISEEINNLNEQERKILHLPFLLTTPLIISLSIHSIIAISGVCLSLSTHSYYAVIPFVVIAVIFSLFIFPSQGNLLEKANEIKRNFDS